jgi:hypothetical protein
MAGLAHSFHVADPATDATKFPRQTNNLAPLVHGAAGADQRESQWRGSKLFAVAFLIAILGVTCLWAGFILWILWTAVQSIF